MWFSQLQIRASPCEKIYLVDETNYFDYYKNIFCKIIKKIVELGELLSVSTKLLFERPGSILLLFQLYFFNRFSKADGWVRPEFKKALFCRENNSLRDLEERVARMMNVAGARQTASQMSRQKLVPTAGFPDSLLYTQQFRIAERHTIHS